MHDLFCAVPHWFAYQDFTDTSVALQPCLTRCRQNVGSTKTCIKNMKKKRNYLRRYNSLQDCESGLSLFADKRNGTLLHGKQNTTGKILIFWWDDESIYKHKEKQQLTSSSTFQQENRADEKRKDIPHSTSLFFWRAVWWNDDECVSLWLSAYYLINSSIHRIFIRQQVCRTNGRKEMPLSTGRSDIRPACCPTGRQGKTYHINEKKRSAHTAGTLTGFWRQKSHSSLGHFLYAVQAQLKMPQWANGVTPLWTPPFAMRHDRSGR